jgi:hypothetical protein
MSRYSRIPIITSPNNPKRRFINVKYPSITLDSQDIYLYTTQGDRYDIMAYQFYKDMSLWWIISYANQQQDPSSLYPALGTQLRVPSPFRISSILMQYELLNS